MARPWSSTEAVSLVTALSDDFYKFGYTVAIGNSILRKKSGSDLSYLDLYLIPAEGRLIDRDSMLKWLNKIWGNISGLDAVPRVGARLIRDEEEHDPDEDDEDRRDRERREEEDRHDRERGRPAPAGQNWVQQAGVGGMGAGGNIDRGGHIQFRAAPDAPPARRGPGGAGAPVSRYAFKCQFKRPNDVIRLWVIE